MYFLIFSKSCSPEDTLPLWPRGRWPNVHHRKKALNGEATFRQKRISKKAFLVLGGEKRGHKEIQIISYATVLVFYQSPHLDSNVKVGEDGRVKLPLHPESLKQRELVFLFPWVLYKDASHRELPRPFRGQEEAWNAHQRDS